MALNLEKQLQFYGSYHHNPINIAIHIACVPLLLVTGLGFATNTSSLLPLPKALTIPYLPPNLGTLVCLLYSTLYVLLEPIAGLLFAPILLAGTAYIKYLITTYPSSIPESNVSNFLGSFSDPSTWGANQYMFLLHVSCWLAQFVGHGVFEGRAPALLDNLLQAFFLAPFFVWMEILFFFGYRPELRKRVEERVQTEIKRVKDAKKAKQLKQ